MRTSAGRVNTQGGQKQTVICTIYYHPQQKIVLYKGTILLFFSCELGLEVLQYGMALLNILNIVAAAFYLYLFVAVQRMKIRGREHWILSLMALALFQWVFSAYFVYNSRSLEILRILLPFSCIGMFFSFPLNFHFAYSVVFKRPLPKLIFVPIYAVAVCFSIIQFVHPFSRKILIGPEGEIILTQAVDSPLNLLWMSYALACWVIPAYFFIRYHRRAVLNREKKQSALLIRMILFTITIVMAEYYLTLLVPNWSIPSQSPLLFAPWVGAMVYAIWRYGFLRISPGLLAEKILDSVEDLVVLYSMDGRAVYRNRKAEGILGESKILPEGSAVPGSTAAAHTAATGTAGSWKVLPGSAAPDAELVEKAVQPLLSKSEAWNADYPERQLSLQVPSDGSGGRDRSDLERNRLGPPLLEDEPNSEPAREIAARPPRSTEPGEGGGGSDAIEQHRFTIDFRVKPILDRFGDPLGVLVSGTVVPHFSDLLAPYRLTGREEEVLEHLMAGRTIAETAKSLYITDRTVKAHISKIYEKTGASNRVELANLLIGSRSVD